MGSEDSLFERIETLIPFKEPEFAPKARMGKLNLGSSAWAISAKLGRYLLSGAEPDVMDNLSRTVAAYFTGADEDELTVVDPDDLDELERYLVGEYAGGASFFRVPAKSEREGAMLLVVAHDKAQKKHLGEHSWFMRSNRSDSRRINVMKLPCALGLMEIVSQAASREALAQRVAAYAVEDFLRQVDGYRAWFRGQEAEGHVTYSKDEPPLPAGFYRKSYWAKIQSGRYETHYAYDAERLWVEGKPEELAGAAAARAGEAAKKVGTDLLGILAESKWADRAGALSSVFRELAEERWDEEACREANRRYARSDHIAGVFEDKKQCDEAHREAASSGYLARNFLHVEVDDDVDLGEYRRLVDEFEARDRAGEIPQIKQGNHELRFRKCGRHRAIGVYAPLLKAIAVDPRAPRSLLHEFAHAYDFEHGMLSGSPGFRPILKAMRVEFEPPEKMGEALIEYYKTPTEVFARGWEVYAALSGYGGSFVQGLDEYREDPAYVPLIDHAQELTAYYDAFAKAKEPPRLVSAQERALGMVQGGETDISELRRLVVAGEVDVDRLRSDLMAMGQDTPDRRRVLDDLSFAAAFAPASVIASSTAPVPDSAVPSEPRGDLAPSRGGEQMSLFDLSSMSDEELERIVSAPAALSSQVAAARGDAVEETSSYIGRGGDCVSRDSGVAI